MPLNKISPIARPVRPELPERSAQDDSESAAFAEKDKQASGREKMVHSNPVLVWWQQWQALLRTRILFSILMTMTVAAVIASNRVLLDGMTWWRLLGLTLVVAGAIIVNQVFEARSDRLMPRTARRPIAAGYVSTKWAISLAIITTTGGILGLIVSQGWLLAGISVLSWLLYVAIYTPLKTRTLWQTPVGAVVGAAPVMMGALASNAGLPGQVWVLFWMIFFWQFPHAMAIAVLYRDEFAVAGIRVAPVVDQSGRWMSFFCLLGIGGLFVTAFIALILRILNLWAAGILLALTLVLMIRTLRFLHQPDRAVSRSLLRVTLFYLFVTLAVMLSGAARPG